jgi:hypothetical protein
MESDAATAEPLRDAVRSALQGIVDSLPELLAAVVIVLVGWLLARLARRATRQLTGAANRLLERTLRRGTAASTRLSPAFISVTGELIFWLVLIFSLVVAASVAGLGSLGEWLNRIVLHLPSLLIGALIIVEVNFFSVYLRELVTSSADSSRVPAAATVGRLAQAAVLTVAIIIGLDQAGIDVAMLMIVFAIVGGGLTAAVLVAFGLGARHYVGNLIGARNARHFVYPGMRLRVGEIEGEVLELTHTHVAMDTADGKTLLPAQLLETQRVLIVAPAADEEQARG